MAHVAIGDFRIWYEIKGRGNYLLQIGGVGFAHENFVSVDDEMARHFTVINLDLRGYGLSDRPEQDYSMRTWSEDIVGLLDHIGVERTHVHGTSMGGMVAIALAADHADRVDRLVLSCTSAKVDFAGKANIDVWRALAMADGMGSRPLANLIATQCMTRNYLDGPIGEETIETIRQVLSRNCSATVFCAAIDAMKDLDLRDDLDRIEAQTLVMVGSEDRLAPLSQAPSGAGSDYLVEHIPSAELCIIEGCGHTNLMERPEQSAAIIVEFLERATQLAE